MGEVNGVNLRVYNSLIQLGLNQLQWVIIDNKMISQMVSVTPRNVSRSLNFLIDKGYIEKGFKKRTLFHYRLIKKYDNDKELVINEVKAEEKVDLLVMKLFEVGNELQRYKILLNSNSEINQEQIKRLHLIENTLNKL